MKLSLERPQFYRVKKGQTLEGVAEAFGMPPSLLIARNSLSAPPEAGQVLLIPSERGNLYTVRGGESKTLLCGSPERYEERNGTPHFHIGQTIYL